MTEITKFDARVLEAMDNREWLASELAKKLSISPSSMGGLLKGMRERRLVDSEVIHCGNTTFNGWKARCR